MDEEELTQEQKEFLKRVGTCGTPAWRRYQEEKKKEQDSATPDSAKENL